MSSMSSFKIQTVLTHLQTMKNDKIWPNGSRYLWTDAHGCCLLLSLYYHLNNRSYYDQAVSVVNDVYRVLGRKKGLRIGEASDRDGQYYHYLTKWMYCLNEMGKIDSQYHQRAIQLVKDIHPHFYTSRGVLWKMQEDLSGPYPGYGYGGLDHFDGYTMYKLLDAGSGVLQNEIRDMQILIERSYRRFSCSQDLGLGETLWMSHWFPEEAWSQHVRDISLQTLDKAWVQLSDNRGYFQRDAENRHEPTIAFGNFGISIALQAINQWPERVSDLQYYFENFHHDRHSKRLDNDSITWVMKCNNLFPGVLSKSFTRSLSQSSEQMGIKSVSEAIETSHTSTSST